MICPYAKDIGYEHIKGCALTHNEQGNNTYLSPCTEACYNGEYKQCPCYVKPEETEK
uniref:Uncharacterized protein n=1 Tax=viral metagenome TaxID=1070528 RepID=A0A6M3LZT1_9ZZZZ